MKNWRLSTNISLYYENGTRYGRCYTEGRIGTLCDLSYGAISNNRE